MINKGNIMKKVKLPMSGSICFFNGFQHYVVGVDVGQQFKGTSVNIRDGKGKDQWVNIDLVNFKHK